ncbi:MAG TPA: hypothetical protein VFX17_04510 [Patescibacteria group bacterium]|nr:hypothetical protein [Patescibacteria group bacterium]
MDDQIIDPNLRSDMPEEIFQPETGKSWYRNKLLIAVVVAVLLAAGVAWYVLGRKPKSQTPESSKVSLVIKGPDQLSAGTEGEYQIIYTNGESADLTNVHIDLIYPSNFQFKSSTPASKSLSGSSFDLPILRHGDSATLTVRGKLSGATDEQKVLTAKLSYELSNFNSIFTASQTFTTTIQAPNLTFEITGPPQVPVGQDTSFTVNYANVSNQNYDNVAFKLTYPMGFKFTQSSTPPSRDTNYWLIGSLSAGQSGHIDIGGSFLGSSGDEQIMEGELGQVINNTLAGQISSTATFTLKEAPITVIQSASPSGFVDIGGSVQFTINYQNTGTIGLTNLVISDTFDSSLVDLTRLNVSNAVITGSTITWKTATDPDLSIVSPGKKGQVQFTLPLKGTLPATIKNQVINNSVTVSSSEVTTPIRAQDLQIKLGSDLSFSVTGDYVTGAKPMRVGQQTTFAVTFTLSNSSNDLNSGEVVASLPLPPSSWNSVVVPDSEKPNLLFDESSGIIRWEVGDIPAFAGKLTPVKEVTFQLVVTPQASDSGQSIKFLSNIQATGFDSFTNQKLSSQQISQFSSTDIDDASFRSAGNTVQ